MKRYISILFFFFCLKAAFANVQPDSSRTYIILYAEEDLTPNDPVIPRSFDRSPDWKHKLVSFIQRKAGDNKRSIAAVLAFPLFGIVGLHRIYLGTKPYVPVVYIATLGGCAGILPLIDFCVILLSDKETFESYQNNPRVFMWAK
jgi:hypothetical protein